MNIEEKDRLFEILLYLYFNNFSETITRRPEFWIVIQKLCTMFGISEIAIGRAIRILSAKENCPQDDETYYLLNKMGLTVRPIRKISGIYWQKQKAFEEAFKSKSPVISRRITDVVLKKNIRDFVFAVYQFMSIFSSIDLKLMEDLSI